MNDTKSRIVAAARDIFIESGLEGMTMRKVAQRVGVSATAIYRHFRDKDALLSAVVAEGRELLGAYLFRALEAPTAAARLEATGLAYVEFAFEHPGYFEVFFMSWGQLDPSVHGRRESEPSSPPPTLQFLFDRIRESAAEGFLAIDPGDEQQVFASAMHLWAHVHGLAALWVNGGGRRMMTIEQWRATCRGSVGQLMRGLQLGSKTEDLTAKG